MEVTILQFVGVEVSLDLICGGNVNYVDGSRGLKGGLYLVKLEQSISLKSGQDLVHYRYDQNEYDEIECFAMRISDVTRKMKRKNRFGRDDPRVSRITGYMFERICAHWLRDNGIPFTSGGYMRTKEDTAQQDFIVYGKSIGCKCTTIKETLEDTLKECKAWLYPAKDIEKKFHLLPIPDYVVFGLHDAKEHSIYIFGWVTNETVKRGYVKWINGHATHMIPKRAWKSMGEFPEELEKYKQEDKHEAV